ncbi:MAG: hypothetical protein ACLTXH_13005 [Enterobacter hormaechei]
MTIGASVAVGLAADDAALARPASPRRRDGWGNGARRAAMCRCPEPAFFLTR